MLTFYGIIPKIIVEALFMKTLKSENEIIEELRYLFQPKEGIIGIGDDAAMIEGRTLVSTDAVVEGVHFLKDKATWNEVAYKLFASTASDMAAMGGYAQNYFLNLGIPEYWANDELHDFIKGMKDFHKDFPGNLLGGDIVKSPNFFAALTVMGKPFNNPWLRSGAKPGDNIYVTGYLGDSRLYLKHLLQDHPLPLDNLNYFHERHYKPSPRIPWAEYLSGVYRINAAIDISDGFVEDLGKLCVESECSFYVDANNLPLSVSDIGSENFHEHRSYYQKEALIGGEDYELIIITDHVIDCQELQIETGIVLTRIGRIMEQHEDSLIVWNGKRCKRSDFAGFRHHA